MQCSLLPFFRENLQRQSWLNHWAWLFSQCFSGSGGLRKPDPVHSKHKITKCGEMPEEERPSYCDESEDRTHFYLNLLSFQFSSWTTFRRNANRLPSWSQEHLMFPEIRLENVLSWIWCLLCFPMMIEEFDWIGIFHDQFEEFNSPANIPQRKSLSEFPRLISKLTSKKSKWVDVRYSAGRRVPVQSTTVDDATQSGRCLTNFWGWWISSVFVRIFLLTLQLVWW